MYKCIDFDPDLFKYLLLNVQTYFKSAENAKHGKIN